MHPPYYVIMHLVYKNVAYIPRLLWNIGATRSKKNISLNCDQRTT